MQFYVCLLGYSLESGRIVRRGLAARRLSQGRAVQGGGRVPGKPLGNSSDIRPKSFWIPS